MSSPRKSTELSRWLGRVRGALGVDKGHFAEDVLKVSRAAMQHWETGRSTPSAETFIKLAKLSINKLPSAAIWFLKQAGIGLKELRAVAPEIEKSLSARERPAAPGELFEIPCARLAPRAEAESPLLIPSSLIQNRATTTYLRLFDDEMSPMFGAGDVIVLDESEIDPWKLTGKWIAIYKPFRVYSHEQTAEFKRTGRLDSEDPHPQRGVMVGLLRERRDGGISTLLLEGIRGDGLEPWRQVIAMNVRSHADGERHLLEHIVVLGRVVTWVSAHEKRPDK
jgi:DNA-binding XRE family transcriptional regulator